MYSKYHMSDVLHRRCSLVIRSRRTQSVFVRDMLAHTHPLEGCFLWPIRVRVGVCDSKEPDYTLCFLFRDPTCVSSYCVYLPPATQHVAGLPCHFLQPCLARYLLPFQICRESLLNWKAICALSFPSCLVTLLSLGSPCFAFFFSHTFFQFLGCLWVLYFNLPMVCRCSCHLRKDLGHKGITMTFVLTQMRGKHKLWSFLLQLWNTFSKCNLNLKGAWEASGPTYCPSL